MIKVIVENSEADLVRKLNNLKVTKENIITVFPNNEEIHVWYDDGKQI